MKGDSPKILCVKTQSFYRETPEERESFVSAVEMWRTYWPMTMLKEKTGWEIDIVADWIPRDLNLRDPKLEKIVNEIGKKYDIVYSSYWRQAMQETIMQVMCQNHGIKRIMDVDDDLFHLSDWNPLAPTYAKGTEGRMKSEVIVGMAEHLTTTTEPLKEMYQEMRNGRSTTVMPNYAPLWFYKHRGNNRQTALDADFKVVIGWHGSMHHKGDLALIWDAVKRIMDKYPYVHLHTVAEIPQGAFDPRRVKVFNAKRGMDNWQKIYQELDFDIGICPLEDTKFNKGKCVTGDSLVVTDSGLKRIDELVKNSYTGGVELLNGKNKKVSNHYKYKSVNTIKITTKKGYSITGTPEHRIKDGSDKWKSLRDFEVGDKAKLASYKTPRAKVQEVPYPLFLMKSVREDTFENCHDSNIPKVSINEDWGRFLGYVIGDGHIASNAVKVSCTTDNPDIIEDVERLALSIGLRPKRVPKLNHHHEEGSPKRYGKGVDVAIPSQHLVDFLRHLGMKKRHSKVLSVPEVVMKSPKKVVRQFLMGLFEADGTVSLSSCSTSFTTKSEVLARQVQMLLLGFGVISSLRGKLNKFYQKYYYTVSMGRQGSDLFYDKIGFVSESKRENLKILTKRPHSNAYKEWDWTDEVVSIEKGNNDVYDIEVEKEHYYLANGFISHNSNIKYQEMALMNAAPVCSNVYPYQKTVTHEKDGLLVKDGKWYDSLERLVTDHKLRRGIAMKAKQHVLDNYTLEGNWERWKDLMLGVL